MTLQIGPASEDLWSTASGRVRIGRSRNGYALKPIPATLVAAGSAKVLRLAVPERSLRAIRRALRHGRPVRAMLVVSARDAAGNIARARRTIKLVR